MGDYFKFDLLPSDIKTQVFSFVRFADWIQLLSKVCTEWRHLCKTTTLPKVLDVREVLPPNIESSMAKATLDKVLQLAQKYNVTGLIVDAPFNFRSIKTITKALPKLSWLHFLPAERYIGLTHPRGDIAPLTNSITHLEAGMIANAMKFEDLPVCLPNLQVLNFNTNVTLDALNKMQHKFEKVKSIRTGIRLVQKKEKKKRLFKRKRTAGENVSQLIDFVHAFKKIAPSLTELYMFWDYKRDAKPAELKREFEAVEEAAASMGIKLYCRDLVRILKRSAQDPKAEFFLACYKSNNLPYHCYTFNRFTLLQHAIASKNVAAIKLLFKHNLTNMNFELSVQSETNRVAPEPPCMTDSAEPFVFPISQLIPYSNSAPCLEIVEILRENGYDVSKMIAVPKKKVVRVPVWSKLNLSVPSVRALFQNYTKPIKWFDKADNGETLLHRIVVTRGTPVYLDLMEKQLTKQEIEELLKVPDDKGNTPAHLFGESSVNIIDRLIPYAKQCWTLKNKMNRTPLGQYIHRCQVTEISLKEPKLRRFIQEAPHVEDNDIVEMCRTIDEEVFLAALPLLVQKKANLLAQHEEGLGLFFLEHRMAYFEELKRHGVDLKICDDNGNNFMHAIFTDIDADRRELIAYLVKEGVNINQVNKNGVTPLMKAIFEAPPKDFHEVIETLLTNGADPNLYGPKGFSPLITALSRSRDYTYSKKEMISTVKLLLEHGAKPISIRTKTEYINPLAIAISNLVSVKLIKMLVEYGADIKERDDSGNSLLMMVTQILPERLKEISFVKFERVVDYLLTHLDINDRNVFGENVLHRSIRGKKEMFDYLVSKGADINARDHMGDTPLFAADKAMAFEFIDYLVSSPKLDPLAIGHQNKTLLHILAKAYEQLLKPFMERFNAMPVEKQNAIKKVFATNDGVHSTALHYAVSMPEFESVKICVEVFGLSPAMKHAMHIFEPTNLLEMEEMVPVLDYLLKHGCDINALNAEGNTPLHEAIIYSNNPAWIKLLLEKGADPTIKNKSGKSANDLMRNLTTLKSDAVTFVSRIPMSAEALVAHQQFMKEEKEAIEGEDENERNYNMEDPEEDELVMDHFNSDEMDEGDADMEMFDNPEDFIPADDEEDEEDEDEDNMEGDDNDNDDDGDDRPRKGPRGGPAPGFFNLGPDIKTQVFSFVRFADWIQLLSKVCSEWRHLCKTTTLPKVLDVREVLPPNIESTMAKATLGKVLQLAQQYNITGLVVDAPFNFRSIKTITKALPKLLWLHFLPAERYIGLTHPRGDIAPLTNSITHLEAGMIANAMKFEDLPVCLPNLQVLNFNTNVTLDALNKMQHKFEKVKSIRTGIRLVQKKEKKKRLFKRKRTAGENVSQLIEFVHTFKKIAPSLTELYMFWDYKRDAKPAELKREFEAVEEAAASMGIKLYCRDLVRILKRSAQDPKAEFFLACYKSNNLPYHCYTFNRFTLLQHAIASKNVAAIKLLFKHNLTNMNFELSVQSETNRVAPEPPCMTDSAEPFVFPISQLIPYSNSAPCLEIVEILRENGYDVSKMIAMPKKKIVLTPVWSKLNLSVPSVRALFQNYTKPIKWFDKSYDGQTLLHKIVVTRGTPVYLDLMEKQLTKQEIEELLKVPDDKGNTPVHLFGESSVNIIDRLIPYAKQCWMLKNKKNRTPLGQYIYRCQATDISIKEPKLRRFIQETPKIEDSDMVELCGTIREAEFPLVLPLLVQKKANLLAQNEEGLGLFFLDHRMAYFEELKRHGIDLKICDDKGNNFLHALFVENLESDICELIEFLVKEGVNVNQVNKNGVTPLIKAIETQPQELTKIIDTLLKNGADPNLHGPNGFSPLITLLGSKHTYYINKKAKIAITKLLLDHGAKPVSVKTATLYVSPLAVAVSNVASVKLIKMLVEHGADIKERDDAGNSLLMMVSEITLKEINFMKYERVVDYLLTYFDINDRNSFGETVLHKSVIEKQAFDYLVSKGADINARDYLGDTPLFLADAEFSHDVADALALSPKLDLYAVSYQSKTALHVLAKSYEDRMKPFMERFNAMPVEEQNAIKKVFATNDGIHLTALHEAVMVQELECVKICVEVFGLSPAMKHTSHLFETTSIKEQAKMVPILDYLIAHGANINAQNEAGNTPLLEAIMSTENPGWIKILLERGADPTIKNNLGKSAIDLMPSLSKLNSGAVCFGAKVPSSAEAKAAKEKFIKDEQEMLKEDDKDERYYNTEEPDEDGLVMDHFNSDDMDEGDADLEMFDNPEDFMPAEDDEEDEEDDENMEGDDNDDDDDGDDDEDDRPRKGPRGGPAFNFGPGGFQFRF